MRPDFLFIDVLGNRFENWAVFKNFDDSCCFATSSFSHLVLRFATMLKRPNDEALIYHTLIFGWVVLPFSDVFWAEESWLILFRNVLFCSPYFDYYLRQKIGIWWDFWWALSGYLSFTPNVFIFCRNLLRKENLFSSVSRLLTASLLMPAIYLRKRNTLFIEETCSLNSFFKSVFLKLRTLRLKRKLHFWHAVLNFSLKVLRNLKLCVFETIFLQCCSAHWEGTFDKETLFYQT